MNSITKKLLLTGVFAFAMAPTPTSVARNHSLANTIANNAAKILGGARNANALIGDMASAHAQLKKADPKKANEVLSSINHSELAEDVALKSLETQMQELRAQLEEVEDDEAIQNQINALSEERQAMVEARAQRRAERRAAEEERRAAEEERAAERRAAERALGRQQQQQNNNNPGDEQ